MSFQYRFQDRDLEVVFPVEDFSPCLLVIMSSPLDLEMILVLDDTFDDLSPCLQTDIPLVVRRLLLFFQEAEDTFGREVDIKRLVRKFRRRQDDGVLLRHAVPKWCVHERILTCFLPSFPRLVDSVMSCLEDVLDEPLSGVPVMVLDDTSYRIRMVCGQCPLHL